MLAGKIITFGITGSIYAIKKVIPQIQNLVNEGVDIIPIMSFNYGENKESEEMVKIIERITNKSVIHTTEDLNNMTEIRDAETMIIAPCSGDTIAKLANGIIDTPMLIAVEMHLKSEKNIIVGVATTEGLGLEAENIGKLLNSKNFFFVPFRQDNPITKPNSLRYSNKYILETIIKAIKGEQIQPILL